MIRYLVLFLLALSLRLGYTMTVPKIQPPDAGSYDHIAWHVATEGRFENLPHSPTARRTPSYVLFVAGIYKLVGRDPYWVRLVQDVLGSVFVLVLIALARRITQNPLAPWMAGLMAAVYPFSIYYENEAIAESFMMFWLTFSLWMFLRWRERPLSWGRAVECAGSFAVLCLAKTVFIPWVLFILATEGVLAWKRADRARIGTRIAVIGLVFCIPIVSWGLRNQKIFGRFALNTHGGMTSLEGVVFHPESKAGVFIEAWDRSSYKTATEGMNEAEQDAYLSHQCTLFIREHPMRYARQVLSNVLDFWRFYPRPDLLQSRSKILISLLTEPFLIITGFLGLYLTRSQWRTLYPVYAVILLLTGIHGLITAQMRYRLPIMPLLMIFSAAGIVTLPLFRRRKMAF